MIAESLVRVQKKCFFPRRQTKTFRQGRAVLHFHLVSRSQPFRFLNSLDKFVSYSIGRKVAGGVQRNFCNYWPRLQRIDKLLSREKWTSKRSKLQNNFLTLNIPLTEHSILASELIFKQAMLGGKVFKSISSYSKNIAKKWINFLRERTIYLI